MHEIKIPGEIFQFINRLPGLAFCHGSVRDAKAAVAGRKMVEIFLQKKEKRR